MPKAALVVRLRSASHVGCDLRGGHSQRQLCIGGQVNILPATVPASGAGTVSLTAEHLPATSNAPARNRAARYDERLAVKGKLPVVAVQLVLGIAFDYISVDISAKNQIDFRAVSSLGRHLHGDLVTVYLDFFCR